MSVNSPLRPPPLAPDFSQRLEESLRAADRNRWRRMAARRLQHIFPLLLLAGPIVAWRLMLASPDGPHVAIEALATVTFFLDVGVHIDTVILRSLGLQLLPSVVGALLLVLVTGWLLTTNREGS